MVKTKKSAALGRPGRVKPPARSAAKSGANGKSAAKPEANPLWGGRFQAGPSAIMQEINTSIAVDRRLYQQDIAASKAHCAMLAATGILSAADGKRIVRGLDRIAAEIEAGDFAVDPALEDIHMHIETRLGVLIGPAAKRLHTARSRNDQVATDFRLWVRAALDRLDAGLVALMRALLDQAERHVATVMPGFTHLQPAQPVTFGHHLMAYFEMFSRDRSRAADCRRRLNESPLGAAALAGTSFPIDREMTARALGFARPMANSIDAVSDRDFALEYLSLATIAAVHLSRLAEELVIWSSPAYGFVWLSDGFTTGSSIMPQKRNPDAAELVRAKSGAIAGALQTLIMVMKGLPLAYGKDMQEDKAPTFRAADDLDLSLAAMAGMVADLTADAGAMRAATACGHITATDLADWLVKSRGFSFRDAHHAVGRLVQAAEKRGVDLAALSETEIEAVIPGVGRAARQVLNIERALNSRKSFGGTAPSMVRRAIARARKALGAPIMARSRQGR